MCLIGPAPVLLATPLAAGESVLSINTYIHPRSRAKACTLRPSDAARAMMM